MNFITARENVFLLRPAGHHAEVIALSGDSYRLRDRALGLFPLATPDDA